MIDLKLPKKSKTELKAESVPEPADQPKYPYGLRIRFENEQFSKLAVLKKLNVGDRVGIVAVGEVTEKHESERQGRGDDRHIGIQIQQIDLKQNSKKEFAKGFDEK